MERWQRWLGAPLDGASLAVFRMGFGAIMLWECWRYLYLLCVPCFFTDPSFLFKYHGFGWVAPPSEAGMVLLFQVMGLLSLGILVGACYRFCTIAFLGCFAWVFLIDQARYLNHFYMVLLFASLLVVVPAHRLWSVDAWLRPRLRSATVPRWAVLVLVVQLEIILLHAGLAKLNWDWLNLEPLRMWLAYRDEMPLFGALFRQDWAIALAAYGVIALHLLGAPLLLFRATRAWVLAIYAGFHSLNHFVFTIGIFPWFTLFASLLCFDPDWPRQVGLRIRQALGRVPGCVRDAGSGTAAAVSAPAMAAGRQRAPALLVLLLVAWLSVQAVYPLRHWVYPGDVAWNEEGHRFAWRMKLRSKRGNAMFLVRTAEGESWLEDPRDWLNAKQARKMACIPDMLLQFAHWMAEEARSDGYGEVQVYANVHCALNGRPRQRFIDPEVDLAKVERGLGHNTWVLPLTTPLPDPFLGIGK